MSNDVRRACGVRTAGSIYATTKLKQRDSEVPFEYFMVCPVWQINPTDIGLSAQGVSLQVRPDIDQVIYDMYDVVGKSSYPYVSDFVEEGRALEFSRKIPQNTQFSLLTQESRHLLLHARAFDAAFDPLYDDRLGEMDCPKGIEHHDNNEKLEHCIALSWESMGDMPAKRENRRVNVVMPRTTTTNGVPTFSYTGAYGPRAWQEQWGMGIFMWLPIDALEVINDPLDGTHEKAMKLLQSCGTNIPYYLADE